MPKIVFITGATSGFGKACAEKFASEGYDLILNGRREERLQEIKAQLERRFNVAVCLIPFDVRNREEAITAIQNIPEEWQGIDVLINNAGLAVGRDYFDEANIDDWDRMIDTNVKGLLYVSKAVIPFMIKHNKGHIINLGSIAGNEVYEKGNVYCASKFAVDAISQSMRIDLLRHGIKVTNIEPGAAETEFGIVRFKGDEATAKKVYDGLTPLSANDVADIIYYTTTLPQHVCINEVAITCVQQANTIYFNRRTN
ncbi:MAG TPA: SDR family NAD(P)-dependent oxidoreductase [Chitinophagaceae bacterium]|jgi:NADP-dependent 3-hydroxy acid dehydrogenase YdfG|nr:SDR family NAD(P)-dependent oxidoreductase [Chitinophagaceae bacterium]